MNIPKSFMLFGQKWFVEMGVDLIAENDFQGESCYRKNLIRLQANTEAYPRMPSQIEQTFCHEVMHVLFYMAGEDELRTNEKLVDLMGCLLHQMLTTAEYDKE